MNETMIIEPKNYNTSQNRHRLYHSW